VCGVWVLRFSRSSGARGVGWFHDFLRACLVLPGAPDSRLFRRRVRRHFVCANRLPPLFHSRRTSPRVHELVFLRPMPTGLPVCDWRVVDWIYPHHRVSFWFRVGPFLAASAGVALFSFFFRFTLYRNPPSWRLFLRSGCVSRSLAHGSLTWRAKVS